MQERHAVHGDEPDRSEPGTGLHAPVEPFGCVRRRGSAAKDFRCGKQVLRIHDFSALRDPYRARKIRNPGLGGNKVRRAVLPGITDPPAIHDANAGTGGIATRPLWNEQTPHLGNCHISRRNY